MSTRSVRTPTSRLRLGLARVDITPPVGIFNRLWGAARQDRATGVHRPLTAEVLHLGADDGAGAPHVRAQLDLCGLAHPVYERLAGALAEAAGVGRERVAITFSHTHSAGWLFPPERFQMPGGELVGPYFDQLEARLRAAAASAAASSCQAILSYGLGRCDMAANRDYWDDARGLRACGFNPDGPADDTVTVARAVALDGRPLATLVHYACHPTTLAWENSLLSPDYVGAARETVEAATAAPCLFLLGACGELGPRRGFVGDPAVADANGRQLGHAALSALAGLLPPGADFGYDGPVLSGATLGTWSPRPHDDDRARRAARFAGGAHAAELPLRPKPARASLEAELAEWQARERTAEAAGDRAAARDHGAMVERVRRWLGRLDDLPDGETLRLPFAVYRLGDALWVTCAGEPYSWLTADLRRRFPEDVVLLSPLAGLLHVAYLLPRESYGLGLYQEEPSILAPGCLEGLAEAIAARAAELG
jgi:hypothetical protein